MRKEGSPAGFLSKVVKFVRNPTTDWAELDQPVQDAESTYSKEVLKQMIERKRQNDFVRRREFDHLRKLRRREPVGTVEGGGRTSFFQSSLPPTNADERAQTIKKIDEIEAQMSRQWWKGRQQQQQQETSEEPRAQGFPVATSAPAAAPKPGLASTLLNSRRSKIDAYPTELPDSKFVPTQGASALNLASRWQDPPQEFVPTEIDAMPGIESAPQEIDLPEFTVELAESETDPDLEEAAIRFANGDFAGAEAGLLMAIQGTEVSAELRETWMLALFDLYRATGQQDRFERVAQDYYARFAHPLPTWYSLPELLGQQGGDDDLIDDSHIEPDWISPQALAAVDLVRLQAALRSGKAVSVLDWRALESVHAEAVYGLGRVFADCCAHPLQLVFRGYESLDRALRRLAPPDDRTVSRQNWQLRMDALRLMNRQDEFELAALEYCVLFEMSPPSWQEPQCSCDLRSASGGAGPVEGGQQVLTVRPGEMASTALSGEITGDAQNVLARLDLRLGEASQVVISCERLIRIDFTAAGSLLNWVVTQRGRGRQVQFRELTHIVAAFFNVIGIGEHARLYPRMG